MKHKVFAIFDDKAKAYLPPFFLPEMGMAIRTFADCCNDSAHAFGRHPADYTLMCLGTWDSDSARFQLETTWVVCANGLELVKVSHSQPTLPFRDDDFVRGKREVPGSLPADGLDKHE